MGSGAHHFQKPSSGLDLIHSGANFGAAGFIHVRVGQAKDQLNLALDLFGPLETVAWSRCTQSFGVKVCVSRKTKR